MNVFQTKKEKNNNNINEGKIEKGEWNIMMKPKKKRDKRQRKKITQSLL